jgi:dienelactone hydrolase
MKSAILPLVCVGLALGCREHTDSTEPPGIKEITFSASDGGKVFADFYPASKTKADPVILMFHQAGSNAGEYSQIAPEVKNWGFDCLAVDQRSGGDMFDRDNRTANAAKGPKDYMDAYADLVGAVTWAKGQGYKTIIAWGSSYSSALCLRLASENPSVNGLILFSPGEYFDQKALVQGWASTVKVPVYFACTRDELPDRQPIFHALVDQKGSVLDSIQGGIHGSSTCIPDKAPGVAAQYMEHVQQFLESFGGKKVGR